MFDELTNVFNTVATLQRNEIICIVVALIVLYALAFTAKRVAFAIYNRATNEFIVTVLTRFIYHLDEFADNMSNNDKREAAIERLQSLLSYKLIRFPKFILGWIVDLQVAEIRKLQRESMKDADLHK